MSELEDKLKLIQDEKNNKVKSENIKEGVQMFGVLGRHKGVDTSDATVEAKDILVGKTAYKNGQRITGTMPNNGILTFAPGNVDQQIPEGYTSGGVVKAADIVNSLEYDIWVDLTNQILGESPSIPVYKGLLLCLENKAMTTSTWIDEINGKTISITNGSVTDNTMCFNGYTEFDTGISHSQLVNGYTIITRINPSSWGNYKGIAGLHGGNPGKGLVVLQYENGDIKSGNIDGTISQIGTTIKSNQLPTNTWNIATVTYDKATGYGVAYVNKEEISRSGSYGSLTPFGNLIAGKAYASSERYYRGYMSHFLVYDRALTSEEISEVIDYINKRLEGN